DHEDSENLDVAARQLTLMERYLERFLSLRCGQPRPYARLDLAELVKSAVGLVRPAAKHHGAELASVDSPSRLWVQGDAAELEQVFVNLLVNALEAAVGSRHRDGAKPSIDAASRAAPANPPAVAVA